MNQEEHDMLIRVDERVLEMVERHKICTIPVRLALLEKKKDRIEAIVALILFLVAIGRVYDSYEVIKQLVFNL